MDQSLDEILTGRLGKKRIVTFLENHPELFDDVVKISLGDKDPQSWRAAWMIYHCMETNDNRILPHIDSILSVLSDKKDGHQREFLKVIRNMNLTEDQESFLFDICLTIWEEIEKSPSARGTAFETMLKIVEKYPELKGELGHLTQDHYTKSLSPGIKRVFFKMLEEED